MAGPEVDRHSKVMFLLPKLLVIMLLLLRSRPLVLMALRLPMVMLLRRLLVMLRGC